MPGFTATDHAHMAHALRLAELGLYTTQPNPRVGCVIAHGNDVVGTGWHARVGEPHAEVFALREACERAHGATAYVTLEPCAHYGRTPPCADALIAAGVARVVAACTDSNPKVAGGGMQRLRDAGLTSAYSGYRFVRDGRCAGDRESRFRSPVALRSRPRPHRFAQTQIAKPPR